MAAHHSCCSSCRLLYDDEFYQHKVGGIYTINIWDALFNTFGNPNNIFYCFTPVFLYFVSDFLPELAIGEYMMLRLRSRKLWWIGKVVSLSIAAFVYILLLVFGSFVIFGSVFRWSDSWSAFAANNPSDIYIVPEITNIHPYLAFLCLLSLLLLGWVSLGILVLLCILAFKSARWGFSVGLAINLAGLVIHRSEVTGVWTYMSIGNHLLFAYHSFGDRTSHYPSLMLSYVYWGVWIVIVFIAGMYLARYQDFVRRS